MYRQWLSFMRLLWVSHIHNNCLRKILYNSNTLCLHTMLYLNQCFVLLNDIKMFGYNPLAHALSTNLWLYISSNHPTLGDGDSRLPLTLDLWSSQCLNNFYHANAKAIAPRTLLVISCLSPCLFIALLNYMLMKWLWFLRVHVNKHHTSNTSNILDYVLEKWQSF